MTRLRRALLGALGLLLMACSQAAPASPTQPAAPAGQAAAARSGGVLRMAQDASDLGTLDPHFASGTQDRVVVDMVFNGLLRYKPGDGRSFEPDLATSLP